MRLLADSHISVRTVRHLAELGYDVVRVADVLSPNAGDPEIVAYAANNDRVIVTQDLDFSRLVSLSGRRGPSVISLRLGSPHVEKVNAMLERVLPKLEDDVRAGAIVTVENKRMRVRALPVR